MTEIRSNRPQKASLVRHPVSWLLVVLGCQVGCHALHGNGRAAVEANLPPTTHIAKSSSVPLNHIAPAHRTNHEVITHLSLPPPPEASSQGTEPSGDVALDKPFAEQDIVASKETLPLFREPLALSSRESSPDQVSEGTDADVSDDDSDDADQEVGQSAKDEPFADEGLGVWCADSVYLRDWESAFSKSWIAQNSHKYKGKGSKKRLQAAQREARSEAYVKLLLPHLSHQTFDYPVVVNREVLNWIQYFQTRGRHHFVTWLRRGQDMIPKMTPVLKDYGLPTDLVYLAMIESGFNNRAYSFAAAAGTWQFIRGTARRYGLRLDDYVDSRRDPAKATLAAAMYLQELYILLGDWHLAAASYNAGEGRILKALKKIPDGDFWTLSEEGLLPKETRQYVPKMIAAMIISKNPEKFGFDVAEGSRAIAYKFLTVDRSVSLKDLASAIDVDDKVLENLNPELRTNIVPPPHQKWGGAYAIRVPSAVYAKAQVALNDLPEPSRTVRLVARVGRSQTLGQFAARAGVKPQELLKSNPGFRLSTRLKRGQQVAFMVQLGSGALDKVSSAEKTKKKKSSAKRNKRSAGRRL